MTLPPNRIEAAARAMADIDENEWDELSAAAKTSYRGLAIRGIAGAYPELANGTAWLAPTTPTTAMEDAHFQAHADAKTVLAEVPAIWSAMRDAFLQEPKDNGG